MTVNADLETKTHHQTPMTSTQTRASVSAENTNTAEELHFQSEIFTFQYLTENENLNIFLGKVRVNLLGKLKRLKLKSIFTYMHLQTLLSKQNVVCVNQQLCLSVKSEE